MKSKYGPSSSLRALSVGFFSFLFVASCSKSEKGIPQQQRRTDHGQQEQKFQPTFFRDDVYPLRMDYVSGLKFHIGKGERHLKEKAEEARYRYTYDPIYTSVSLYSGLFDHQGEDWSWNLFEIEFYPTDKDFGDYLKTRVFNDSTLALEQHATTFGNIPAIPTDTKYFSSFYLLIPNYYARLIIMGDNIREHNPEEISQELSNRVADITKQMLQRLQWLKPIDVNSQEFKDWKAHILGLIDEVNKKY